MTVTSKVNKISGKTKEILKTIVNETAINVGINALKTLRIGRALIE